MTNMKILTLAVTEHLFGYVIPLKQVEMVAKGRDPYAELKVLVEEAVTEDPGAEEIANDPYFDEKPEVFERYWHLVRAKCDWLGEEKKPLYT